MRTKKLALIVCAAILACKPTPQTQEVRFQTKIVESNSMTRATDHDAILSLIHNTYPNLVPVLQYDDGTSVSIQMGRTYTINVGTWQVNGSNSYITMDEVMSGGKLANEPKITIDTEVEIKPGVTNYTLPAEVKSVAFVYQIDEVQNVYYTGKNSASPTTKLTFGVASGNYCVFFLEADPDVEGNNVFDMLIIPSDSSKKSTTFYFSYTPRNYNGNPVTVLENGKYYVLHPEGVTEVSGNFNVSIPEWTCGLD